MSTASSITLFVSTVQRKSRIKTGLWSPPFPVFLSWARVIMGQPGKGTVMAALRALNASEDDARVVVL